VRGKRRRRTRRRRRRECMYMYVWCVSQKHGRVAHRKQGGVCFLGARSASVCTHLGPLSLSCGIFAFDAVSWYICP